MTWWLTPEAAQPNEDGGGDRHVPWQSHKSGFARTLPLVETEWSGEILS